MSPTLFAMLYGAIGAVTTIWWMRREVRTGLPIWDAVGVVTAVFLGLVWPFTAIGMALPFVGRVLDRIADACLR